MPRGALYTGLEDRVVLVTGGTRGIGAAIARGFADIGAYVAFNGRNQERAEKLIEGMGMRGRRMRFVYADLTDDDQCERMVDEAAAFGKKATRSRGRNQRIDVLVCCAGVNDNAGASATRDEIRASLDLNLGHYIHVTRLCWPFLERSQGSVVYIGSKTGEFGQSGSWAYSAANAGISGLTVAAANKGARNAIRVNTVVPAEVNGEHYREWAGATYGKRAGKVMDRIASAIPLGGRMTTEAEIANSVVFLASPVLSSHTTGTTLRVDGGYPRLV
jgi:NAD(P)-dependent dehydrogenase (short-subunit alcohol dehydrogenase family)